MEILPNKAGLSQQDILYIGFNQDQSCFVCGTQNGFRVYNADPFRMTFRREFECDGTSSTSGAASASGGGGLCIVAMLFRCNILALVGGGKNPRFQPHKVMIWDDKTPRCIAELSFRSNVRQVKLGRELITVCIDKKLYVYRFSDLTLLDHVETCSNPKGLCALSADSSTRTVLACPGGQKGKVLCVYYDQGRIQNVPSGLDNGDAAATAPTDSPQLANVRERTTLIDAHESGLAMLSLNFDGSLLATASDKGTLVRIWHTETGALLQELRRGVDRADIQCITFSANSQWLVLSSDKGTVHVFAVHLQGHLQGNVGGAGASGELPYPSDLTAVSPNGTMSSIENNANNLNQDPSSLSSGAAAGGYGRGGADSRGNAANASALSPSQASVMSGINKKSHFSAISGFGGILGLSSYFQSEWSFAQFRVPDCRSIVSFGSEPNTVIVACASGAYFKCRFDPRLGGEMIREDYKTFSSNSEEVDDQ